MVHARVEKAIALMRRGVAVLEPEDILFSMGFAADDARAIAAELKVNSTLKQLNLFNNAIGPAGAASLAEALGDNTTLAELYLGNNAIGAAGAASLADALGVNATLTELNLYRLRGSRLARGGARSQRDTDASQSPP
jgi:hypothetical protein